MSTKRHTLYNLGGAVAPVLMMLVTVPLYIRFIGEARYGVMAIVWLLTGYFSFFDFGLGRATAYAISRHKDSSDEVRARTFWTALIVNAGFGLVGGLIVLAISPLLFNRVFNLTPDLRAELSPVLPWLALAIPLLTFEGVFTGALTGRERFFVLNVRTILGTAITQFLPILAVWLISPSLGIAIPATIIARTISVALLAVISFRAVPAGFRPMHGGREMMRELLGYGGWVSLSSFLNPLIVNADRFLIASLLDPKFVSYYVVPYQLVSRASVFSSALSNALFPRLARMDSAEAREMAWKAMRINAALMLVPCLIGIFILKPFLAIWISPDFAEHSALIGQLVALSLWLNSIALIPFNLLQARGRPKETTAILILQFIPFIVIAIPAVKTIGIVGAVLARNIRSLADVAMLSQRAGLLRRITLFSMPPFILLISMVLNVYFFDVKSFTSIFIFISIIFISIVWVYFSTPELKAIKGLRNMNISALRGALKG